MPDKFRSGEITNKYDQVVEPAIVSGYEELKRKVDSISDEQKCLSESYINFTTQYADFYQTTLQHVPTMISKVINMEAQLTAFRPNIIALAVLLNKIFHKCDNTSLNKNQHDFCALFCIHKSFFDELYLHLLFLIRKTFMPLFRFL